MLWNPPLYYNALGPTLALAYFTTGQFAFSVMAANELNDDRCYPDGLTKMHPTDVT
jgi:hypothetical protein